MTDLHAHARPRGAAGEPTSPAAGRRRGPVDPVRALMHRHHDLCARAVDPLEIAAGLEAHGITDRTAARFRHRDVFSLAEELYARVPRETTTPTTHRPHPHRPSPAHELTLRQVGVHLLPGAVCLAGVVVSHVAAPGDGALVGGVALAAVAAAARTAVRRGPLRAPAPRGAGLWTCWLLAFALFGPQSVTALLGLAGPSREGLLEPVAAAGLLARAFALLPAAWLAGRFARRSRSRLADSHGLTEFAAGVRPLLVTSLGLFTVTVAALLVPAYVVLDGGSGHVDPVALGGSTALGVLLFTAQLLAVHGSATAAAAGTAAACAVEAAALAIAAAGHVPALAAATRPLRTLVETAGPGSVQAVACGAATLALIACALPALGRACAHGTDRATGHATRSPHAPTHAGPVRHGRPHHGHHSGRPHAAATSADRAAAR